MFYVGNFDGGTTTDGITTLNDGFLVAVNALGQVDLSRISPYFIQGTTNSGSLYSGGPGAFIACYTTNDGSFVWGRTYFSSVTPRGTRF